MGKLLRSLRRPKIRGQKGQASLLVGAMLLTFILFFAFVINTGMLVNAKINLQNAADAAAYAGAATQARQLTQISYLNYEMRRQWKKFLFRYYVLGNFGQETHPTTPRQATRVWAPRRDSTPYGVPAICVNFDARENVCQNASVPGIPIPPNPSDALTQSLANRLQELEALRQGGCVSIGIVNTLLRQLWLFNTDPDLTVVLRTFRSLQGNNAAASAQIEQAARAVQAMASGLGVIPRLALLRKRIETLEKYVNHRASQGLTAQGAVELKSASTRPGPDWAAYERTIQAYFSAYNTLGNHSFDDPESIVMDELLPPGGDGANVLKLEKIRTQFGVYSVDMIVGNGQDCKDDRANQPGGSSMDCTQCLSSINLKGDGIEPIVGVAKDPSVLTYYAVRLSAKAKTLFSPFGPAITLTAYSAAQPFGSRIGPLKPSFSQPGGANFGSNQRCIGVYCPERIPNLPVGEDEPDEPSPTTGWNSEEILATYFNRIAPQGSGSVPQQITQSDLIRAYQVAMSPNPWEAGKYNIPNDLSAESHVRTFSNRGVHAIWAPLIPPGAGSSMNEIRDMVTDLLRNSATAGSDSTSKAAFPPELQESLISGMEAYVNDQLRNQSGEDGEGIHVVRLYNPYLNRELSANPGSTPIPIEGLPERIWLSPRNPLRVSTSWNGILDAQLQSRGRTGYSVKFIPLQALRSGSSITTDGSTSFSNRLPASDDVARELERLLH